MPTSVLKRVFCQHCQHDYPHHAQHYDHQHHDQQHPPHFLHRDVIISPRMPSPIIRFAFQYTALRRVIFDLSNMSSSSSSSFITVIKEIITTWDHHEGEVGFWAFQPESRCASKDLSILFHAFKTHSISHSINQ